jgi:pimeloyl-ACP methyl ester carboxylesterase/RimJ/RimL family protein N-acetyltransferase
VKGANVGSAAGGFGEAEIATQRLLLTPLRPEDADPMAGVLADERLHEFIGGRPASAAELRSRYRRLAVGSPDPGEAWLNWIVRLSTTGEPVGTVQATVIRCGERWEAVVAWVIGTAWQGRGYASEAARALVGWLSGQGATVITANIHPRHAASARVAERAGLVPTAAEVDGERVWQLSRGRNRYAPSMTRASNDQRLTVRAPGGRTLDVLVSGSEAGLPLVFHTGTPAGLAGLGPMAEAVSARGLRAVLYARPGYGDSTPQPSRLVADAAADVAAILDRLGADEFVTAGWSGGGPHALACAALLPVRCLAAASIAGIAPSDSPGLDWLAGMGPENIEEFEAALAGEADLTRFLEAAAGMLRDIAAAEVAEGLGGLVSDVDQAVITGEFADYLAASFRAALTSGIAGWRDDDLAFARDWGISLEALGHATPVAIWQGDQDRMVPSAHGDWLATNIPLARARLRPDEGHLTLVVKRFGEILDDLLALAGKGQPPGSVPAS